MVFVFVSVHVMDYVYRLEYVEPGLYPRDEAYLMCYCNWFASILLKIFASVFIMDIGMKISFFVESLPGFGIWMMLVS